jgi:hypothetical protein
MAGYWIAAQLAVGSVERSTFTDSQIEDAIARGRDLARLDALLLWPSADPRLMERLIRACRSRHVRPYLWFPVLCDLPGAQVPVASQVMSCTGSRGHGRSGAWKGLADGDEHFLFACPNDERFLEPALRAFEARVDSLAPDGVMLDRIRFPSPSNGFESLLGCFCDSCRTEFGKETGESMDGLRGRASAFLADLREKGPQEFFAEWADSGSPWKAAGLQELAAFRSRSIVRAVQRFSTQAHSRGREVGLDLFSPSLAPLVGQDYAALGELCEWIKPMTYSRAVGPAGLPLEIACLRRGVQELCPASDPVHIRSAFAPLFPWKVPDSDTELLRHGLPVSVISSELAAVSTAGVREATSVYAGLEAVSIPRFGIDITAEALRRSLAAVRPPARGVIASWNLLHIPEANLRVLGEAGQ